MVRALAKTKDAHSCVENSQIVVSKELMILPNIPQFMRRGDTLVMKTLCTNLSNKEVSAKVSLKLFNPTTGKSLPIESKEITLGQQESKNVDWVITTNGMNSEIGIEVWLESDDYKDGERHIIPIIEPVESFNGSESAILINEKKIFNLNNIIVKGAQNQYLGVIASSPQVMLLQALPNNLDSTSKSFIDLINRWYINGAGGKMALKYSTQIKNNSLLKDTIIIINESVLENIALSQSPWATEDKTQRLNYLIKLLDTNYIKLQNSQIINSINNFQNSDGGFPWFNGMQSSFLITNLYLNRANSLITLNLLDTLAKNTIQKSIDYLDNYIDRKSVV